MSWLRPSRTVTDPRGTIWEIYVTRIRTSEWKGLSTPDPDPMFGGRAEGLWFLLIPVMVAFEIIVGILKLIALVPLSLASTATRRGLRIETISEFPVRQSHVWSVEKPVLARALDEVAAGLEQGAIPRPDVARSLGERE